MKQLIALILLTTSHAFAASEECTYSQSHQHQVLSAIAQRLDGASLDEGQLNRTSAAGERTSLRYGGCHDLGVQLTRTTPMAAPRTRAQVFALAQELATTYLSPEIPDGKRASERLLLALRQGTYKEQVSGATTRYEVADDRYIELQLTHRFHDDIDEVTISWYVNT